ncbi:MAG: signal peptide peptidase SppA [Planctomycetaceae bacterium]
MPESYDRPLGTGPSGPPPWPKTVVIQQRSYGWIAAILCAMLLFSSMMNVILLVVVAGRVPDPNAPIEVYVSGDRSSDDKIAILEVSGAIMPPLTERWLKAIEAIEKDDHVRGVVLHIDSPGGLVADSHQIYHALNELREKTSKPIDVSMARIAASGGYYIAMGAGPEGRIYAEPTTWTGSIGVILNRFDVSELAEKVGVKSEPLVTGKFKDTLNPFRDLTEDERELWATIIDDSFVRFKQVIVDGRAGLDEEQVSELATGQVYTSSQAEENGLIDEIGFLDDAIGGLSEKLGLDDPLVITYEHQMSLTDLLTGASQTSAEMSPLQSLLESSVPRVMYFCGWNAGLEM